MTSTHTQPIDSKESTGHHPLYPKNDSPHDTNGQLDSDTISPSRLTPESVSNGILVWREQCSERRAALDKAIEKVAQSGIPGEQYVIDFLRQMYRRHCRPGTIRAARFNIFPFLMFIKEYSKTKFVNFITRFDFEAFIEHEQDRGLKPSTVRSRIVWVYAFLKFLTREGILPAEILDRRIQIKMPQRLPRALATKDVDKFISTLDKVRDRAIFLMLLRTGMRVGELLKLYINDVDLYENKVKIYEGEKNAVGRVVYFSDDARDALREWLKIKDPGKARIFHSRRRSTLGYESVRRLFAKYIDKAGLADKGYTIHCLRHTYASQLLNAGLPLECLRELLGHSSLEVTRIYARLTDNTREEQYFKAMEKVLKGEIDGYYQFDN